MPLLDLTVTNPTEVGLAYPAAEIAAALGDARAAQYQPASLGLPHARVAVAADFGRRGVVIDPAHIVLTASSSESYGFLWKLLCDPGDVVLVPEPSYPLFEHLARLDGVTPRPYRLAYDGRWHVDFSSLDATGARALCAVSPNNPTGSYLSRSDHERLVTFAAKHDLALVIDEVFADFPLGAPADAVRTVAAEVTPALTFSLGGLSKSCGLPQLKLGWMAVTGPATSVQAAVVRLELIADTYLSVAAPVQHALPRLFELGQGIRAAIAARVAENRDHLSHALGGASPCTLLPAEAGWAAILRLPATLSDEDWALRLCAEDGVLVAPGYFYDLPWPATLVLSLLPEPAAFAAGVARILARAVVAGLSP